MGSALPMNEINRNRGAAIRHMGGRQSGNLFLILFSLPMFFFLALPLAGLLLRIDPTQFVAYLFGPQVGQALGLSLRTTAVTLAVAVVAGTPLAYCLARCRFRGRQLVDTLVDLPMVLPPAVAGVALLLMFGRRGILGSYLTDLGIAIAFTEIAVIMAQVFVAAPFFIRTAINAFGGVERELEQAAALDGAGPWQVFRYVTVPLVANPLLGGAVMTWARALGEFGATIIFAGNFPGRTQTMPLAIYLGFELDLGLALTLSAILLCTSFLVLFILRVLSRGRISTF